MSGPARRSPAPHPTFRRRAFAGLVAAVGVAVVPMAVAASAAPASAAKIGPNQAFGAAINGRSGVKHPVTITMACGGPAGTTATGHPVSGQTISVFMASHGKTLPGNTGSAHSIGAFFGPPPPQPVASSSSTGSVVFHRYGKRALPTSLVLPCGGSGMVTFVPLPPNPSGAAVTVPVSYVNVAVSPQAAARS